MHPRFHGLLRVLRGLLIFAPGSCWIAGVCLVVYAMQHVLESVPFIYGFSMADAFYPCFSINSHFLEGFFWQPVTYIFLHGPWWHLTFNLLTLLLFGAGVESLVGSRRFWFLFLLGGILGGVGWLAVTHLTSVLPSIESWTHWIPESVRHALNLGLPPVSPDSAICIGASGSLFALLGAFAALYPQRTVYILLFFVIPLRLRARTLAIVIGILSILEIMFVQSQIAYASHLIGGIAGYLLAKRWRENYE